MITAVFVYCFGSGVTSVNFDVKNGRCRAGTSVLGNPVVAPVRLATSA